MNSSFLSSLVVSGSYSSLERWVPQGERLAPQVIQTPFTGAVSTGLYLTRLSLPVLGSWSRVTTAYCDGSLPYMSSPAAFSEQYSNCTTANSGLPFTPSTFALSSLIRLMPSGQSEKNCGLVASAELASRIGFMLMS